MYMYVEFWNTKPGWHALSQDERKAFLKRIGKARGTLKVKATLSLAVNEPDTPYRAPYQYVSVWMVDEAEGIPQLEAWSNEVGWHDYFEQITSGGKIIPLEALSEALINE
jgi:hypothetical protein